MHFCTAQIAIAGDSQQVMHRNPFDPVSWPELEVLRFIHGEDAVTDIKVISRIDQDQRDERDRLLMHYGRAPIDACFGARNSKIEMEASDIKLEDGLEWRNPITNQVETVGQPPPEPELPPHFTGKVRQPGVQKGIKIAAQEKPF
jgi:hypothetical protein